MIRAFLTVLLTVLILVASPVAAQDAQEIDHEEWNRIATLAEDMVASEAASDQQLAQMRARMVEWRSRFEGAQNINAGRIQTVRDQIEALGPPPAEGTTEDEEVARRRSELQQQLATLQAPRLTAVEAFSRADAIIKQLDEVTAQRQASELANILPSPLLPSSWAVAGSEALRFVQGFGADLRERLDSAEWAQLRPRLPQVVGYLAAALLLLTWGRNWVGSLPSRVSARASVHSLAVVAQLVSLGQIAIPMLGVYLAINAVKATGLSDAWTRPVLDALPIAGVILFGGAWLAQQMFPRHAIAYDTLVMDEGSRAKARRMTHALSAILALQYILSSAVLPQSGLYERMGDRIDRIPMEFAPAAISVTHFVLMLPAAVALFRLGSALRRLTRGAQTKNLTYRHRLLATAGFIIRPATVVAILSGAAGLTNLANALIWPMTLSLAMICVLILLVDFTADLMDMIQRDETSAREGLAPMMIGLTLTILSLPVFLIIWGARGTDLAELWVRFKSGMTLGGVHISPGGLLTFLVVFGIAYSITRAIQGALRNSVLPKTRLDPGGQNALVSGLGYVGTTLALILAVTSAGIDLSSLAIVAGALSVGIGFGLQTIVSNFVSGIILLIERPVSVGDWIDAGGQQGIVKRISVRATQIETFDRTEVIVPNSDLISQPVTNWTRQNRTGRIIIPVGVAYGSDTRKVQRILAEIIEDQPIVTVDPPPSVLFRGFGADSLNFEIRAILSDVTAGLGVTSEVCHQIAERFAAEEIEIPFPQRDIWLRNPEALSAGARPSPAQDGEETREAAPETPSLPDPRIAFDEDADGGEPDNGDGDGDR